MGPNELSGYSIINIIICDSSFNVLPEYLDKKVETSVNVNLKVERKVSATKAKCWLTVETRLTNKEDKSEVANSSITAYGIYKKRDKETKLSIEEFARLNGLAILYPFIREHLSSLSLKAGLSSILLPSVNFVAFSKSEDQQRSIDD